MYHHECFTISEGPDGVLLGWRNPWIVVPEGGWAEPRHLCLQIWLVLVKSSCTIGQLAAPLANIVCGRQPPRPCT